jgi:hypothetical protein
VVPILLDGREVWFGDDDGQIVPALEWVIGHAAVRALGSRYLLLHAGAVAQRECALLFPAASGSGKSTLVAALVGAGLSYLGDDVVALDPKRLRLLPVGARRRSKRAAAMPAALHPETPPGAARRRVDGERVWFLPMPQSVCRRRRSRCVTSSSRRTRRGAHRHAIHLALRRVGESAAPVLRGGDWWRRALAGPGADAAQRRMLEAHRGQPAGGSRSLAGVLRGRRGGQPDDGRRAAPARLAAWRDRHRFHDVERRRGMADEKKTTSRMTTSRRAADGYRGAHSFRRGGAAALGAYSAPS